MTTYTPIQQPPVESLKNALTIADFGARGLHYAKVSPYGDIARLIRDALEKLSEPSLAAIQAARILIPEYYGKHPDYEDARAIRDTVAGILKAQLEGTVPKTW